MAEYKYKSKDGKDFIVPNVGASKDGVITVSEKLESPELELVSETETTAEPVQGQQVAQPNAVIGVAPQATVTPQPAAAPVQTETPTVNEEIK